ncbi:Malate synthase, glyoxysomal [Grifola frondosa]|uniref:Malate synthase n=1 Tax=Grifola frondosa TaxID=5627 RepID=A0A1C7M1Q5_GRIFR|nr:Malate synthase, glyoxysomal [Grifola frondosa]
MVERMQDGCLSCVQCRARNPPYATPRRDSWTLPAVHLQHAIRRQIDFESGGKSYKLSEKPAVLISGIDVHLSDSAVGTWISPGSPSTMPRLRELVKRALVPTSISPKWSTNARLAFGTTCSTSRSHISACHTAPSTLPAAFQMEEILFKLKDHSSGLNCGRWDYIFSFIKRRRADRSAVLPDRKDVTMEASFMDAYVRLLIQTCHKRKVAAMGGMSAQIPIKNDPKANEVAMNKVRADKLREITNGHDSTWIAHPLINQIAMEIFNKHMLGPNQYHVRREDVKVAAAELLSTNISGQITAEGIHNNRSVARRKRLYPHELPHGGRGDRRDYALREVGVRTSDSGEVITAEYVDRLIDEIAPTLKGPYATDQNIDIVAKYLKKQVRKEWPSEFLTSDLMGYLAVADGCPAQWQRSVL